MLSYRHVGSAPRGVLALFNDSDNALMGRNRPLKSTADHGFGEPDRDQRSVRLRAGHSDAIEWRIGDWLSAPRATAQRNLSG